MASFHFAFKAGPKGQGSRHAQYICREGAYSNGDKAEELVYKEHGNMPAWAADDPQDFWKAADENERAGGRTYSEFEIDLPNELTQDQQIELAKEFVKKTLGKNHPYTYAIHTKRATIDGEKLNPHAHIMFTERKLDGYDRDRQQFFSRANPKNPDRGGTKKDREFHKKETPYRIRVEWADLQNKYLERYGHSVRVDARSLREQYKDAVARGDSERAELLNRIPERHLGPNVTNRVMRDVNSHIQSAANQQDTMRKLAHYYTELEPNEKAYSMYLVREMKRTMRQLEISKARLSQNELSELRDTKDITFRDLASTISDRMNWINSELPQYETLRDDLREKLVSDKRAYAIATFRYLALDNTYKPLTEEAKKLQQEAISLDAAESKFAATPPPSLTDDNTRKIYESEKERLAALRVSLTTRQLQNTQKLHALREKATTPEAKAKIDKIKDGVLLKNKPIRDAFNKTLSYISELRSERKELSKLHTYMSQTRDYLDRPVSISGNPRDLKNIIRQMPQIASQLKKTVRDMIRTEARVKGQGLKAELGQTSHSKLKIGSHDAEHEL